MHPEQIYAIVDIEATGGSVGADERIIQLACVLIQNGEVIHTFETLVNPGRDIPKKIIQLTGISNKDVKRAPYFEEVAPIILNLLKDSIFVAHNVGFDYRFLSEQFKLHDFEPPSVSAIDTVELTQILYPALTSFQLEDIAAYLGYDLKNAHDALADAEATVYIFEKLFERALYLPLVTLEKLVDLAACTTHETSLFFKEALEQARLLKEPLADDLVVVRQIALQKPTKIDNNQTIKTYQKNYPSTKEAKQTYFKDQHTYRDVQAEMMDLIYNYLETDFSLEKLAIEAPPGIGKSLGYLFPASFFAAQSTKNKPIIVSTYTTVLQDQLIDESLPELETILQRKIPAALAKSSYHYLSLSVFERWLNEITGEDSEAYLCMRLLVWLTDTKTGDLSEINAGSHLDLVFWQEIRASNTQYLDEHWKTFDFYERLKKQIKTAEIIITNHHFLVNDWQRNETILPELNNLIVDEAHHFPKVATRGNEMRIYGPEIIEQLEKMGSSSNETAIFQLINTLLNKEVINNQDVKVLERTQQSVIALWEDLFNEMLQYFEELDLPHRKDARYVEEEIDLDLLTLKQKKTLKSVLKNTEEFIFTSQKVLQIAHEQFADLTNENQLLLLEFGQLTQFVRNWRKKVKEIFTYQKNAADVLRWVTFLPNNLANSFQIHALKWGEANSFVDYLATHTKVIFTSSTLSFKGEEDFFSGQLKNLPLDFHQLKSPFDYGQQLRVMLPEENINPKRISKEEYPKELANSIVNIISQNNVNSVVLFRSLSVLEEVYEYLLTNKKMSRHLILAQGISGTRNRILKNFKRNKPAIILGADSFFEGIDLPDEELELLILTRLPFPAPDTPLTRLRTEHLKTEGIHPFVGEYLPQAVLKFKQAFGRLIRKNSDHGVLVVLDDRFLTASYSKVFKEAVPQGVPIEIYENQLLGTQIKKFLEENQKNSIETKNDE